MRWASAMPRVETAFPYCVRQRVGRRWSRATGIAGRSAAALRVAGDLQCSSMSRRRGPRPGSATPVRGSRMRLRLATLNVWGLPEPFSHKPDARLAAIAGRLADLEVDAVAFQEVWTPSARERLARAGRDAGLEHVWHKHPILRGARVGGSGLLVLSRLPIESACFERYAIAGLPTEADYFGGKGFVRLGLATPAGPVELVDTHLQARYP